MHRAVAVLHCQRSCGVRSFTYRTGSRRPGRSPRGLPSGRRPAAFPRRPGIAGAGAGARKGPGLMPGRYASTPSGHEQRLELAQLFTTTLTGSTSHGYRPVMTPTLAQLRYLVAVADCGSITGAAASVFVAQSALSRAVQAMERDLGIELLARRGRGWTSPRRAPGWSGWPVPYWTRWTPSTTSGSRMARADGPPSPWSPPPPWPSTWPPNWSRPTPHAIPACTYGSTSTTVGSPWCRNSWTEPPSWPWSTCRWTRS